MDSPPLQGRVVHASICDEIRSCHVPNERVLRPCRSLDMDDKKDTADGSEIQTTTWDVENLVKCGINYLLTGAGFLPSTVTITIIISHSLIWLHVSQLACWILSINRRNDRNECWFLTTRDPSFMRRIMVWQFLQDDVLLSAWPNQTLKVATTKKESSLSFSCLLDHMSPVQLTIRTCKWMLRRHVFFMLGQKANFQGSFQWGYCWWQAEIRLSPLEVGSLSPFFTGFLAPSRRWSISRDPPAIFCGKNAGFCCSSHRELTISRS